MVRFTILRSVMFAAVVSCGNLTAQVPEDGGDIRPAKDLVVIPEPEESSIEMWAGIGLAALLLVVAALLWKRHDKREQLKSPPEIALSSLRELERARETISAEAFANRAAQTLRQYISDRFGLAAPRRTTEEFLRDVENSPLIGESDHLRLFLKSCDLAKFAGTNLDDSQRGDLIDTARGFIRATAKPPKPPVIKP